MSTTSALLDAHDTASPTRSASAVAAFVLLLGVFFLSGASALMYEVVWTRMLALVFGVTLYAISAVLASFMAGMALGSVLAGRIADRVERPLVWYACIEIAIAVAGVASPLAISALTPLYVWLFAAAGDSLALATTARFLAACAVLLVPTLLMGATLPFMVRASVHMIPKLGENVSLLYAVNTAGAAAGTLSAGFWTIGNYGLHTTIVIAAALNVVAGALALSLAQLRAAPAPSRQIGMTEEAGGIKEARVPPVAARAVLVGFGLSGFCALAYEVIWFRILDLFLNGTVYAFSIMLVTFLVGLAIGSAVSRAFIGRRANWLAVFGLLELLIGMEALLSVYAVSRLPDVRDAIVALPALSMLAERPVLVMVLMCMMVLLPLAVLCGITFPVAVQAAAQGRSDIGARIGAMNAANTVGAILGSLAGGVVLVPVLGGQNGLVLLAFVNLAVAAVLLWLGLAPRPMLRLALVPLTAAALALPLTAPEMVSEVVRGVFRHHQIIWFEEGLENTISVQKNPQGITTLNLNSTEQASDFAGAVGFHQFLGHLPMLLHPDPRDALVVGLGGGATPGAISRYPETQVDVVELSPSVVRAAAHFAHINNNILQQPNVRMIVDDGRNHLLLGGKQYDVITADIIRAHQHGAGNLYSAEYFQMVKTALKEDGIIAQWADTAAPSHPYIARTFLSVFPYVTVWDDGLVLIGSKKPLDLSPETLQRRLSHPGAQSGAQHVGAFAADILRHYSGDAARLRAMVGDGLILTDDRPLTEYFLALPTP